MVRLDITLEEAARGSTRTIDLDRHEPCETCRGSGAKPGTVATSCDYCGGRGQVVQARGFFQMATTCPACGGAGSRVTDPCASCRGNGREIKRVSLKVDVPAGVDTGMILQVRGQGETGDPGAPRGNLRVQIRVMPHTLFEREGANLICRVPISFPQAALGAEIDVPTLDGRTTVTIERGTQTGEVIKLRSRGLPDLNGRGRGDQLVELVIETPKRLSPREEELLRELADIERHDVSPKRKNFFEKIRDYFTEETDDAGTP
jgi:molecular chaperone DnaJ